MPMSLLNMLYVTAWKDCRKVLKADYAIFDFVQIPNQMVKLSSF